MSVLELLLYAWTFTSSTAACAVVGICLYRSWRGSATAYRALPRLASTALVLCAANVLAIIGFSF